MQPERRVRLFRNGRSQAVRIPREFELQGTEAVMRREGSRFVIEPVVKGGLAALLASWEPLGDDFPETEDFSLDPEDISTRCLSWNFQSAMKKQRSCSPK